MAQITIENIENIMLNVLPWERRFDSEGNLAIHPAVKNKYLEKGYDFMPKSRDEADARGQSSFNGLMSSFTSIRTYTEKDRKVVVVDIAPTRYLIGQAMRDIVKTGNCNDTLIAEMSPDMANVSLIAPVKLNGNYYLLSQIKGKALGSGEVHAGLVAGNVDAKYLYTENPLTTTLKAECSEELGLNLSYLSSSSFIFMVDERETGQVNFACVAKNVNTDQVLTTYQTDTKNKLGKNEPLEVMALANLPIAGIALVPLENGEGVKNITCFKPTTIGLKSCIEDRVVRPYTQAIIEYLSRKGNIDFLLEKGG